MFIISDTLKCNLHLKEADFNVFIFFFFFFTDKRGTNLKYIGSMLWGNRVWHHFNTVSVLLAWSTHSASWASFIAQSLTFFSPQHPETLSQWKLYQLIETGAVSSGVRPERWSEPIRRRVTELSPRFWQHGWWYCNWTWTFSTFIALSHPRHYTTLGRTSPDINTK